MTRRIVWSPRARKDLRGQLLHIAGQSPGNAVLVGGRVAERVRNLAHMPTGHQGRVDGTYETVVQLTSLILVFRLLGNDRLQIVRIIHGARDWKSGEWPED